MNKVLLEIIKERSTAGAYKELTLYLQELKRQKIEQAVMHSAAGKTHEANVVLLEVRGYNMVLDLVVGSEIGEK